jgi:hypothetical protein
MAAAEHNSSKSDHSISNPAREVWVVVSCLRFFIDQSRLLQIGK